MHYLIDGHNLIGQLDGVELSDPDDELKLLKRLRRWTVADPRRQVTLFFDGGIFRGEAKHLSGALITVIFSSRKQTADALIIKALNQLKNPQEFTLVTSDAEIRKVAQRRRVAMIPSDRFAADMQKEELARLRTEAPVAEKPKSAKEEPALSEAEVNEWLDAFGPVPERPRQPRRKARLRNAPAEATTSPEPPAPPRSADELKDSGDRLRADEIAEWLELFGEAPAAPAAPATKPTAKRSSPVRRTKVEPRRADLLKDSGGKLNEDEVDAWLDIFRKGKN